MEVHHHPEIEKKGFKEYILEGLMIFLAVFMGFIAENIREKVTDHEREKQYMESLAKDLAADTVSLRIGFPMKDTRLKSIDSVFLFFESHPGSKLVPADVYRQMRRTTWDRLYNRNTGTINQLKNSGVFRLVRNTNVAADILKYDNFQNSIMLTQYVDLKNTMYAYKDIEARAVHYKDLKIANGKSKGRKNFDPADFVTDAKQPFITQDKDWINYYYNRLFIHKMLCNVFLRNIKYEKSEATKLITLIKNEYHLEE